MDVNNYIKRYIKEIPTDEISMAKFSLQIAEACGVSQDKAHELLDSFRRSYLACDDCGAIHPGASGDRCPEAGPSPEHHRHTGYLDHALWSIRE
jgi:hypothetical protein